MAIYKDLNDYEIMYLVEENDEDAEMILLEKYKPIIFKIASQYKKEAKKCGLEIDDLVQEGYLGLYSAIQTYNSSNNVLFYTYAIFSIRSKILNCLTSSNAMKNRGFNQSISLFKNISGGNDGILMDILEDENALLPHLKLDEHEMEIKIHEFMLSLDFSYSMIFELKINGFKNNDIANLLDFSMKYVSNVLFRIRKKLQFYLDSSDSF